MRFSSLQCILTNAEVAIVSYVMIVMMSLIQKEPARSVPKRNMKNKITWILPAEESESENMSAAVDETV